MYTYLLVVHALISVALVGIILMQRSEGGGLAGGGSPAGLISARGAGDFLTRTTAILATIFILLSIGLAALVSINRGPRELDNSLNRAPVTAPGLPAAPTVPMAGGTAPGAVPNSAPAMAPLAAPAPVGAAPKAEPRPAVAPKAERTETKREAAPQPKPERVTMPSVTPAAPKADPAPAPSGNSTAP